MIEILDSGPAATVQDGGRAGHAAVGVPRSGAFDRAALHAANRLVGNPPDAAAIEVTFGGLTGRCLTAMTVALTGAPCPGFAAGIAVSVAAGTVIRLGAPAVGLRSYLAVRGGIAVEPVLGSGSTDTLSGLGPDVLRRGDRLPIGTAADSEVSDAVVPAPVTRPLRVVLGPRDDWFTPAARAALTDAVWHVRPDSNRVGIRLDGPPLDRAEPRELPSEPTLPGALQVPPDGRPILFGPDAPVTGGYPVIAVVADADLDLAAQLRPGESVRFARW